MINSRLATAFEKLGLGKITEEIQQRLLQYGVQSIEPEFRECTKTQLQPCDILPSNIKGMIIQGREQQLTDFEKILNQVKEEYGTH